MEQQVGHHLSVPPLRSVKRRDATRVSDHGIIRRLKVHDQIEAKSDIRARYSLGVVEGLFVKSSGENEELGYLQANISNNAGPAHSDSC
jgi:hypothetical protein